MHPVPPVPNPAFAFSPIPPPIPFHPLSSANNIPFPPPPLQPPRPTAPEQWLPNYPSGSAGAAPLSPAAMDRHPRRAPQMHDPSFNGSAHRSSMNSQPGPRAFHAGSNYPGDPRGARAPSHNANGGTTRSRVQSLTNPSSRRLGSMHPIREALSGFLDTSHVIGRFAQFCSDNGRTVPPAQRRTVIHNFAGFSQDRQPPVEVLTLLNKSDLDSLAWALGLPRGGRKIDVATRIGQAMRAPLQWRMPTSRRANATRATSITPANPSTPAYSAPNYPSIPSGQMPAPTSHPAPPPVMAPNGSRSSMPAMPRQASYTGAARQRTVQRKKGKDLSTILRDEKFLFAENPFNMPLAPPLGNGAFVMFSSSQLSNGMTEPKLSFHTPDITTLDVGDVKGAGEILVHLRCLKVEMGKAVHLWKQSWPFPASARVNTSNVELNQAQRFTNGKLAGMDKATNISPYLRARRVNAPENVITIRRSANSTALASGNFVLFAQPVLVRSMETMLSIVRNCSAKFWLDFRRTQVSKGADPKASDFEMARRQVVAFMNSSDDFVMTSQKISLKCPLSLVPITIPSKGKKCTHIQCFDLISYLEYTRRSTKFNCPVCNAHDSSPASLIISPFFEHTLKKFAGCDEVEIFADGSIKAVQANRKGIPSADSDSDEEEKKLPGKPKINSGANGKLYTHAENSASGGPGNNKSTKMLDVVDLTLDSDDDAAPPPRNNNVPASNSNEQMKNRNTERDDTFAKNNNNSSEGCTSNSNRGVNVNRGEQDVGDFTFEATFQADEEIYPWESQDERESQSPDKWPQISIPRESTPPPSATAPSYPRTNNNSNNNSNQSGWTNSIDVITIDSD